MSLAPKDTPVLPDPQIIARFANALFGYTDGFVAVRLLSEVGTEDGLPWSLYLPCDAALAEALTTQASRAAADRRGLFVVPCTVSRPGHARIADLVQTAVIPVDLDAGDIVAKRDHLLRHLGQPCLEIASGGVTPQGQNKLHLYWRLTEAARGADLALVQKCREVIAERVDADGSFSRMTQPIRVAGSIHAKHGIENPVRLLNGREIDHDLTEFLDRVDALPRLAGLPSTPEKTAATRQVYGAVDLRTRRIGEGGRDGTTRFDALSTVIGHWLRTARLGTVTLAEAWRAVHDHNASLITPPWPEERLKREFDALLDRDRANYADAWRMARCKGDILPVDDGRAALPNAPESSEDALASIFVERHGSDWHHVSLWNAWYGWDGVRWVRDETGRVRDLIRHVCRNAAANRPAHEARRIASAKTIGAVERIASTDTSIAAHVRGWDSAPMALNTPGGIIDLATGEILPHDRDALLTQLTGASVSSAQCLRWRTFIAEITGGDADLAGYLARIAGYCLTGSTQEQVFFFLWGSGANGKSIFLQTLSRVLGSYAAVAPLETFMASRNSSHPTDLAGLQGRRLVTVSETEPGRSWAESRIKTITGGDAIRARFMHRDFFEFTPNFKLMVAGNHRPQLSGVGEAMRRRLHLVPFSVTIPPERRDSTLGDELAREIDGILGWMLDGLAEWQSIGLAPPDCVRDAADEYFADEDVVGQWIAECCTVGTEVRASARDLFSSWTAWAESLGHDCGSQKSLGEALRERGFRSGRTSTGRHWQGIALRRMNDAEREPGQ